MIKTYKTYLINLFLKKILLVSLIFLALIYILSIFDEITFFKETKVSFFYPFFLTALNSSSLLFEIFPFIFLISTQLFYLDLIEKNELDILKVNGLNNLKIIKILLIVTLILGTLLITIFYSFSAKLKFVYLDLKNKHSSDNKYLAVVTNNGLWVKDEINAKIYIIRAAKIKDNFLETVIISEFSKDFDLIQILKSKKVDIKDANWIIYNPSILKDNSTKNIDGTQILKTHFDQKKINSLFRNLLSLNILELFKLRDDYMSLGYATNNIKLHLYKLFSFPVYLSLMMLSGSIIMLNIERNKPVIFHILLGVFFSVIIYYFYYLFNVLGEGGKIPLLLSVSLPLLIIATFILIGLVRINEK